MENISRFLLTGGKAYCSRRGWVTIKKINDDGTFMAGFNNTFEADGRVAIEDIHPRIFISLKHMQEYFNNVKDKLVFLDWLKDNGFYGAYFASSEIANQRWDNIGSYKSRKDLEELMINEHNPRRFISDSFVLGRSKDGSIFWKKIIERWSKAVDEFSDDNIEFGTFND